MPWTAQTTSWSLILRARGGDAPEARSAMERFARAYWLPVYAYVRRKTGEAAKAEDLTQEFFATFLEKRWIDSADREKGRFRTFLLVVLDRFLAGQHDRERALKRGGDRPLLSIDREAAERMVAAPAADPAKAFTRDWALAVLRECLEALRAEMAAKDRPVYYELFVRCHGFDGRPAHETYGGLAAEFGLGEADVTNYLHRARTAFRKILEERVLQSVDSPADLESEIAALLESLSP